MKMLILICIGQGGWDIKEQSSGRSTDFRLSFVLIYEGSEYKFPVKTHLDSE